MAGPCYIVEPERGGQWRLTFAPGRLENVRFFIQIICWANHMLQVQSTVLPSIFLRAQPWRRGGGGGGKMGAMPTSSLSVELRSYRRKILYFFFTVLFQAALFVACFGHCFFL